MKAKVITLGCKVNQYESEAMLSSLLQHGFAAAEDKETADVVILNSCTVTAESDRKVRQIFRRAKKDNPDAVMVLTGCMAQAFPEDARRLEEADIILGTSNRKRLVPDLLAFLSARQRIIDIAPHTNDEKFENLNVENFTGRTRAFVKIEDGCNRFCSYCIIPYARGPIRSKDPKTVIKEITSLVENGYKEIILTGIHTGKYGKDINYTFEQLLKEIIKIKNLYRIRISSIEINELTDPILNLIKDNQVIAKHLHIPLQSGSDKILKLMDRKYDLKFYKDRIEKIRKMIKDISITTDLIVGFPNENEKDMEDTLKFLKEIKFTKIHTFPYSKREGTKAASMENQIDETIKRKRVKTVLELSDQLEQDFYQSKLNETEEVIIEQTKDGKSYGYTSNYIKVEINSPLKPNEVISVKINKVNNKKVTGKII